MTFCCMRSDFRFYLFLKLQEYSSTLWQEVSSLWIHQGVKLLRFMWVYYQSFYATCADVFYDVATLISRAIVYKHSSTFKKRCLQSWSWISYYKMRPQWAMLRVCILVIRDRRVYGGNVLGKTWDLLCHMQVSSHYNVNILEMTMSIYLLELSF